MWAMIGRTFGKGLVVVLPIVLTIYLLWWVGRGIDRAAGAVLQWTPIPIYFPGAGLLVAIGLVFVVGLVMNARLASRLWQLIEQQIERLPLISSLYGSLRDLMDFVSGDKQRQMNRVVMVDMAADGSHRLIGFVTREKFDDLPGGIGSSDQVAVYLPMSYQLGGYTVLMPRDRVHAVDMPIEQAMRFALTAGVHTESQPQ